MHNLHVWTITSGFVAMSAYVPEDGRPGDEVLRERFAIEHATLQVE